MIDIVERLRRRVPSTLNNKPEDHVLFLDAADEIERLRAILEKIATLRHSNSSAASIAQSALDTMKALNE